MRVSLFREWDSGTVDATVARSPSIPHQDTIFPECFCLLRCVNYATTLNSNPVGVTDAACVWGRPTFQAPELPPSSRALLLFEKPTASGFCTDGVPIKRR